jgi:hydroxybutyrate-dimer hydrolase
MAWRLLLPSLLVVLLPACAWVHPSAKPAVTPNELVTDIRETRHSGTDDLLSAGLGLAGLRAKPAPFADAAAPTPQELRRRAIHANWNGIADLGLLGGYGTLYGGVPDVPGREYQAFAKLPGAQAPFRVLAQVPDAFDAKARCLLVAPASGSRGVYGAIALAGAWGLPRGCAVVYTDKGAGTGYYDFDSRTGVALDGTRAARGAAPLEFEPAHEAGGGVAIKHAHSGDNPEADWGRHVLAAARFGLAALDRAFPEAAPFTPSNTRVIAVGLSNGGGAALQAAGIDDTGLLSGVVALEPNVHVEGRGRAAFDYVTEAALYLPCALLDARFEATPFARVPAALPAWRARCARLRHAGLVDGGDAAAQAADALARLHAHGWDEATLATAASTTAFDLWRAIGATYTSAYLRAPADAMPCGFRFAAVADGVPAPADAATRAAWWSDASGIPPGAGIALLGGTDASADPSWIGLDCLRALWSGDDADARRLHASVAATAAKRPRAGLPILIAQGERDGLLPIAFSSAPYVQALEAAGVAPVYWRVPHAQHFDAFLALPGFGDGYVPLLPYGYAALDALWAHLADGDALPASRRFDTTPRGAAALDRGKLGF